MKVINEQLGCKPLEINRIHDKCGWFQVVLNIDELDGLGIQFGSDCQLSNLFTEQSGIIRGLNYQEKSYEQAKIVRCIKGSLYSVAVDINNQSKTYGKWCGFELSASDGKLMYKPGGYAHGFIGLEDNTDLEYFTDNMYSSECAKSIRYDDPSLDIDWALNGKAHIKDELLSDKNKSGKLLKEIDKEG